MKKMIYALIFFYSNSSLSTLQYSFLENKYYSIPESSEVDQELYNIYMHVVDIYNLELINAQVDLDIRQDYIEMYLQSLNDPTAERLLDDIYQVNKSSRLYYLVN